MIKINTTIAINKIGNGHIEKGMNCQDAAGFNTKVKVIADGCSSAMHSEVGAKLFVNMILKEEEINVDIVKKVFDKIYSLFNTDEEIFTYALFTVAIAYEDEDNFYVITAGDSVVLYEISDMIDMISEDQNNMPEYYMYNYIQNKESLGPYADGIELKVKKYPKMYYTNIGVASDGLEFATPNIRNSIFDIMSSKDTKASLRIKKLINLNQQVFADDISIVF